jgi:hypothetical protein
MNSYTGGTVINSGSLAASSIGSGSLSLSGVSNAPVSYIDTMGGGTLALSGGVYLNGYSRISLGNSNVISGTSIGITGSSNYLSISGLWTNGVYDLISGSSLNGSAIALEVQGGGTASLGGSTIRGRTAYDFYASNNSLYMTVAGNAYNLIWSGAENQNWNTTSTNWVQDVNTGTNINFLNYDAVSFGDAATAGVITVTNAGVLASSVTVSNTSGTVALGGGTITATSFTNTGAGNLSVSNALVLGDGTFSNTGSGSVTSKGMQSISGLTADGIYKSTDGYACIRAYGSSLYYAGWVLNGHVNPNYSVTLAITAASQNSTSGNYY